jgi:hypothetical protein
MFQQNHRSAAVLVFLFSTAVFLPLDGLLLAQEKAPQATSVELDDASAVNDQTDFAPGETPTIVETETEKEQLRNSALAGLLVLSLICIVFLILIILVALWARRIRILTRQPLPHQHPDDPLWYLRKGRTPDSPEIAELADGGSPQDEP